MIFTAFGRALAQASDSRFLRVLLLGIGLTLGLLVAVTAAFLWGINLLLPDTFALPLVGEISWVDDVASAGFVVLMIVLSVFLMVPVAAAFTGIFLDDVAAAVEARYYPHLPEVTPVPMGDQIRDAVAFFGVVVAVNLVALILYFFVGPFAPLLFWAVNGFLLGREYFQLVAIRRLGREGATAARRRHMPAIWLAGALMAMPLSIPIVNLLIPVMGAATFTHIFHALERSDRA